MSRKGGWPDLAPFLSQLRKSMLCLKTHIATWFIPLILKSGGKMPKRRPYSSRYPTAIKRNYCTSSNPHHDISIICFHAMVHGEESCWLCIEIVCCVLVCVCACLGSVEERRRRRRRSCQTPRLKFEEPSPDSLTGREKQQVCPPCLPPVPNKACKCLGQTFRGIGFANTAQISSRQMEH